MSIRVRLLLSYVAMIIVPLVFVIMASLLLLLVFRGDFQDIKKLATHETSQLWMNDQQDDLIYLKVHKLVQVNPNALTLNYFKHLDTEISSSNLNMLVQKNGRLFYASTSINRPGFISLIEHNANKTDIEAKKIGDSYYAIDKYGFSFGDHVPGRIYFVRKINPFVQFAREFFPWLFGVLFLILILTNSLLTYLVSRSIVGPLVKLKQAAENISEGQLDFRLEIDQKDEIGQVSIAFEKMRQQLKSTIQKLLHTEENRKELLSNISHDLKTPITAIKGYVEGIQDGVADSPEKMERYMKTIYAKAELMDHLIEDLFLFAKLDLNGLPFSFEVVDIAAFLQDFIDETGFDLEKKDIAVESSFHLQNHPKVIADREKLKRVLLNVVQNSVKYMDKPEKTIRIEARATAQKVILSIRDNGRGMDPTILPHIFERFYRGERSRNQQWGGSGLGLAIAKQIIEAHGGVIQAESEPGAGTNMIIELHLA